MRACQLLHLCDPTADLLRFIDHNRGPDHNGSDDGGAGYKRTAFSWLAGTDQAVPDGWIVINSAHFGEV